MTSQEKSEPMRLLARFPRKSSRGVIMGLGKAQLMLVGVAVAGIVLGFVVGPWWLWLVVIVIAVGLIPTWFTGKPLVLWVPHLGWWGWRAVRGQLKARVRPFLERPEGTFALPGDAARLRVFVEPRTRAGLVHDPSTRTLTAIAKVEPGDSFALAEGDRQDQIASVFGSILSGFCQDTSSGIHRVSTLVRAVSDGGEEIRSWFEEHGTKDVSPEAYAAYEDYLTQSRTESMRHEYFVTITLDMTARGVGASIRQAGGGVTGGGEVLRTQMDYLRGQLAEAQINFRGWASSDDLGVLVRTAYAPGMQPELEANPGVGRSLRGAGPMALDEAFTYFRTEDGYQRVLLVVEWPRKATTAGFLQSLILAHVRHTFALVMEPIPAQKAMREARTETTQAETSRRWEDKSGAMDTSERRQERQFLAEEENALEAGHGRLNFCGLVTVSGDTLDELRVATEKVRTAARQSRCELRVLGGEQAAAFVAAALPMGRGF